MRRRSKQRTYRVIHKDARKNVLTLERRDRRFLRGRYLVVTCETVAYWDNGSTVDLRRLP